MADCAADDQPDTDSIPHSMGTYSAPERNVPPGAAAQLYTQVMPFPAKASVREAVLKDNPRLPPPEPPPVLVELAVGADEATLALDHTLATVDAASDVTNVVGTETAAELDAMPPNDTEDGRWKKPPPAALDSEVESGTRLRDGADDAAEKEAADESAEMVPAGATAEASLPGAVGVTVTVYQLVEVVVVVPSHELVAAPASAVPLSTAATTLEFPTAAIEGLLATAGADDTGRGWTVRVETIGAGVDAALLPARPEAPASVPKGPVWLEPQMPPVG